MLPATNTNTAASAPASQASATSRLARAARATGRWLFDQFFYWKELPGAPPMEKPEEPKTGAPPRTLATRARPEDQVCVPARASPSRWKALGTWLASRPNAILARVRGPEKKPRSTAPAEEIRAVEAKALALARLSALTHDESQNALASAARALADWVGELPASAENHHAENGGLLAHSLDALERAAPAIARLRLSDPSPERVEVLTEPLRLAAALAVLYHDIGKVMSLQVIVAGVPAPWDPRQESLAGFRARHPNAQIGTWWNPGRGNPSANAYHQRHNPTLVARALPRNAWEAVRPFGDDLLAAIGLDESDSPNVAVIRGILGRADRASAAAGVAAKPSLSADEGAPDAGDSPLPTLTLSSGLRPPPFAGILHRRDLGAWLERTPLNTVASPILLGAYTCAIESPSPIYDALVAPQLEALREAGLLATCRSHTDCPESRFEVSVGSAPPGRADADRRTAHFVFVSLLAFGGPILPDALGLPTKTPAAFGGAIQFVGEHKAKPHDFRLCVRTNTFDAVLALTASVQDGTLAEGRHWVRLPGPDQTPLVAIYYAEGLAPLAGVDPQIGDPKKAKQKLTEAWDRVLRLRVHILPPPGNQAHEIVIGGRTRFVIPLIPELSGSILAKLHGNHRRTG